MCLFYFFLKNIISVINFYWFMNIFNRWEVWGECILERVRVKSEGILVVEGFGIGYTIIY